MRIVVWVKDRMLILVRQVNIANEKTTAEYNIYSQSDQSSEQQKNQIS